MFKDKLWPALWCVGGTRICQDLLSPQFAGASSGSRCSSQSWWSFWYVDYVEDDHDPDIDINDDDDGDNDDVMQMTMTPTCQHRRCSGRQLENLEKGSQLPSS